MSYQVLARKWRPKTFDEMVGQEHVLKALVNALDTDRLHHAYLFTGTRGVGKTTVARVLAKCLNCEKGVSSKPCGECSACVAIDEGRFVDLIEVDAASRAKVDETRELMDNVQYSPSVGRYKIYLIDEVHMFSNHSFNALLKTLEEPPPHVKFLLATTEAKKVPVTILSRCLQFNLKAIGREQIQGQLQHILDAENIHYDEESCRMIAKAANGSLRDALSLLDQAISHGGGQLDHTQVKSMLGTIDSTELNQLLNNVFNADAESVLNRVQTISEHNPDYDQLLSDLLSLLQEIAVLQITGDNANTDLAAMAGAVDKEQVQLFYEIVSHGRRDLYLSPEPRMGFEMTLIRMLAFQPLEPIPPGSVMIEKKPATDTATPVEKASHTTEKPAAENSVSAEHTLSTQDWQQMIDEMSLKGLVKELASHCVLKQQTENQIDLLIASDQEHLLNTNQKDKLEHAIRTQYGNGYKLSIAVQNAETETPAQQQNRIRAEQQRMAEHAIAEDPNISAMKQMFGAEVDESSIKPLPTSQNEIN